MSNKVYSYGKQMIDEDDIKAVEERKKTLRVEILDELKG